MAIRKKSPQPAEADKLRCDRCHYYDKQDDAHGYCRRFPPTGEEWQATLSDDWCGEYRTAAREEHLSIAEAGRRYYGLSVNGSYLAARRGDLPWVRIGKQKRVPVSAMELRVAAPKEE